MKKLLLTTIAVLACASAHAAQLPAEMQGTWCPDPKSDLIRPGFSSYVRGKNNPECIIVTPTEQRADGEYCKFTRINKKRHGHYIIYMQCGEAGDDGPLSASIFELNNGKLETWDTVVPSGEMPVTIGRRPGLGAHPVPYQEIR